MNTLSTAQNIKFLICTIFLVVSSHALSSNKFTINTIDIGPSAGKCEFFFKEVFRRLGMKPKFISLPRVRGVNALEKGHIDADCGLSLPFKDKYSNMLPVKEKLNTLNIYLLGLHKSKFINSMDEMSKYKVGALWKASAVKVHFENKKNITFTDDFGQLLIMLRTGRIDYAIYVPSQYSNSFDKSVFQTRSKKIMEVDTYFFIHKRHQKIANDIAMMIKEVKQDKNFIKLIPKLNSLK